MTAPVTKKLAQPNHAQELARLVQELRLDANAAEKALRKGDPEWIAAELARVRRMLAAQLRRRTF